MLGMSKTLHTSDSPLNLLNLEELAKETSFVSRNTQGFCAHSIIIALMKCVQKGDASFHHLSLELSHLNAASLSKSAVYKRVDEALVLFLERVISELLKLQAGEVNRIKTSYNFNRILIEDSSFVPMGAINAANLPSFGNGSGITAGFKIGLAYDILSNTILHQRFGAATQSDKTHGNTLMEKINAGDLILRDMGCFSRQAFLAIEQQSAFWLTRLPSSIEVKLSNDDRLEKKLNSRKCDFIDEIVTVGKEGGFKARLVGIRANHQLAAKRRRQRRAGAKKFGNQPKYQSLVRDGWHLILTNLEEALNAEMLFELYSIRWNIETRFKAWKQSLDLKATLKRYSNLRHLESIALAALIH